MRAAVVTTTINVPHNLEQWAATMSEDDIIIISGDKKSPHDEIHELCLNIYSNYGVNTRYVDPESQDYWSSSKVLPWNCIQRRNIAFLEAALYMPKFIVTVDDDNYPLSKTQINDYEYLLFNTINETTVKASSTGWYNIGEQYSPRIVHRGYPLEIRNHHDVSRDLPLDNVNIGVASSLWVGDPDIDAIERIAIDPEVTEPKRWSNILDIGTWCPFNSQATAFRTELLPLYMMWPNVGRFDDIWASYMVRAVLDKMNLHVHYGAPLVEQVRNEHNLVNDLENEILGYRHTLELTNFFRNFEIPTPVSGVFNILSIAKMLYKELKQFKFLHGLLHQTFDGWVDDMERLAAFPNAVNFTIKIKDK